MTTPVRTTSPLHTSNLVLLIIFIISFFIQFRITRSQTKVNDLCQDYLVSKFFLTSQPIYQLFPAKLCWQNDYPFGYQYSPHPPTSILLILPLAFLNLYQATLIWDILNIFLYFFSLIILFKIAGKVNYKAVIIAFCISSLWIPLYIGYASRNFNFVILFLLSLALYSIPRNPKISGFLIAIASMFKLWPIIFLGLGILNKKYLNYFISGVITFMLGTLISLAIFGPNTYLDYINKALPYEHLFLPYINNVSLTSMLEKSSIGITLPYYPPPPMIIKNIIFLTYFILLTLTLTRIFHFFVIKRNSIPVEKLSYITYSTFMVFVFVFFPLTWDGSSFLLLIPLSILIRYLKSFKPYLNRISLTQLSLGYILLWMPQIIELFTKFLKYFPYTDNILSFNYLVIFIMASLPLLIIHSQLSLFSKTQNSQEYLH